MAPHETMDQYLESSTYIDWTTPSIVALASQLSQSLDSDAAVARACFEWVRDEIQHCSDFKIDRIACTASDVLLYKAGFCFAKSHLLAALLRANGIPSGLCYQRLSLDGVGEPYCLHGLNAIYLQHYGWYKADPRGNKAGVDAQFCPPVEQLAFNLSAPGEYHLSGVWHRPMASVVNTLTHYTNCQAVLQNLPDIAGSTHGN